MPSRPLRALALAIVTALFVSTAQAAEVNGKLLLGAYKPAQETPTRAPYHWEIENGFKEVERDRIDAPRELAVVLVGDGDAPDLAKVEIPVSGGELLPSTVVVRQGATLSIRNDDEIAHELVAEGLDGFSAEPTSPRAKRSINLAKAGAWPLRDRLVSHARGYLHVLPNLVAVATVDADGNYKFGEVAPGKYTLKVFHGERELTSQEVEAGPKPVSVPPLTLSAEGGGDAE